MHTRCMSVAMTCLPFVSPTRAVDYYTLLEDNVRCTPKDRGEERHIGYESKRAIIDA